MASTVLVANTGRPTGSAASRRMRARTRSPACSTATGWRRSRVAVEPPRPAPRPVRRRRLEHRARPHRRRHRCTRRSSRSCSATRCAAPSAHIDFLQVNLDEEITVSVPLRLEGEADGRRPGRRARRPGRRLDRGRHDAADDPRRVRRRHHRHGAWTRSSASSDIADAGRRHADRRSRQPGRHRAHDARRGGRDRGRRRRGRRGAGRGGRGRRGAAEGDGRRRRAAGDAAAE